MERARTRERARARLSLPSRGRATRSTSSSSSSRPSSTPRPRPLPSSSFFRFRAPSDCSRLLEGRARASARRPQLGSICSRGRGPGGEEERPAVQSTGGRGRGGDGRGLREPPRPIAVSPRPDRPNRISVGGAAFKVRCAVRWGRGVVPSRPAPGRGQRVASKESAGFSGAWDAFRPRVPALPSGLRLFSPQRHHPGVYLCEEARVEVETQLSPQGRKPRGLVRASVPCFWAGFQLLGPQNQQTP